MALFVSMPWVIALGAVRNVRIYEYFGMQIVLGVGSCPRIVGHESENE